MLRGSRSWTDTTTNSVLFHGLDSAGYFRWMIQRDMREQHLVGQFLHEFTHHWCHRTLLGAALSLTELRLCMFTETYPEGRPIWARDLVASRTLMNLLRPLSEGLAQMAEYDLTHKDGESHPSTPLGASVLCFGVGEDDLFRHQMLQSLRHSSELLERKASLYFKKFEVEDGYLPGYMAAKNIALTILGRGYNVPIEVCLAYVRSYFWDDPVLVNILVSEETNGGEVASRLLRRFAERLSALYASPDIPGKIQSFWRKWQPETPSTCAAELGCDEQQFEVANSRIGALEQHYHHLIDTDGETIQRVTGLEPGAAHSLLAEIADNRRYVVIATTRVAVGEDGNAVLDEGHTAEESVPTAFAYVGLPPGLYEFTALIPTFATFLGVLAQNSGGEVFTLSEVAAHGCDDGVRESTLRFVSNRSKLQVIMDRLRTRFQEQGMEIVKAKSLHEILAQSYEEALRIYAIAATVRVQDQSRVEAVRSMLRTQGLKPILAKDTVAAQLVAGMSMLSGTDQWLEQHVDGLVMFAQHYFLQDIEQEELMKRRDAILERDVDGIMMQRFDDLLFVFV